MADSNLSITNIAQFLRVVNAMQKDLPDDTRKAANQVAKDWVSAARNKASGPYELKAAAGLTVGSDSEGSKISNSYPGFYGQEFGGGSKPETQMFPPHKGRRGYWFYPAARENITKFQHIWEAAVDNATKGWK